MDRTASLILAHISTNPLLWHTASSVCVDLSQQIGAKAPGWTAFRRCVAALLASGALVNVNGYLKAA